jgi:hypothetical protein
MFAMHTTARCCLVFLPLLATAAWIDAGQPPKAVEISPVER